MLSCFILRSLKALWGYLKRTGVNTTRIWESIKDIVVKTIIRYNIHYCLTDYTV